MDINRFTQKAQEAISSAQTKAARYGHQQVDVEHLLASLLDQEGGLASSIFSKLSIQMDSLKRRVEQELERMPRVSQSAERGRPDLRDGPFEQPARAGRRGGQKTQRRVHFDRAHSAGDDRRLRRSRTHL